MEAAELWDVVGIEQEEQREKERFSFRRPTRKSKKAEEKTKFKETLERKKVSSSSSYLHKRVVLDARVSLF